MQTEVNELKARHQHELSAMQDELNDTVDEFSTLSYNSRVVSSCISDCSCFNPFKPSDVKWSHSRVLRATPV